MVFRLLFATLAAVVCLAGAAQAQGKAELLWYSQAAFKITTPGGKVIMVDPWIMGATKIPPELKDLSKIGKVDLILVNAVDPKAIAPVLKKARDAGIVVVAVDVGAERSETDVAEAVLFT